MGKWGIWMGKIKEGGKGKKEEKSRLFICAVIFLIFGITIGCGGYVDNNGNIVESSDAEKDSIFYQNKELTQFDIDVYQYFKNYKRDYADMVSFRKDLPGRVILIIDEGSPITPWDILDFKMKEDGRFEFEIVDKNKSGEIKLKEGDILMGWVDRFYIKSGKDIPPEYIRWVNFFGKVTSVISDRDKKVLLVYTEPKHWGYVIDMISLENIYLDWADIIEEAASPQAPKFNVVRVSSHLEAKSFEGKKRILLKFNKISECLNYIKTASIKYITLPNGSFDFRFKADYLEDLKELKADYTIGRTTERWGELGNISTNEFSANSEIEFKLKKFSKESYEYGKRGYGEASADATFKIKLGGNIKFILAGRECEVIRVEGSDRYIYQQLDKSGSIFSNLYIGQSEGNFYPWDFAWNNFEVFSFREGYSGWSYDLDVNVEVGVGIEASGAKVVAVGKYPPPVERIPNKKVKVARSTLGIIPFAVPIIFGDVVGFVGTGFGLGGKGRVAFIVNLKTNCTKESFGPVLSIAELPFFK